MHQATHNQPSLPFEEAVRRLAELGWSTRRISRHLARDYPHASQSTVSRTVHRINTGPQPIIRPADAPTRPEPVLNQRATAEARAYGPAALAVVALLIAAAAAAGLIWGRDTARPPPVVTCVRYSASGSVTGLSARPPAGCPPGWTPVTFPP